MYNSFRSFCERLLRIPADPEPPPGDEASTRVFNAAPNFYKYLLVMWTLRSFASFLAVLWIVIVVSIPAFTLAKRGQKSGLLLLLLPGFILLLLAVLRFFALAMVRLDFEKRWYVVTDRSLRVREGVFAVREMTVTFANIQNISISQGPVQRALGIADLRVDTAGGGAVREGKQPGMNLHTAWFRGVNNANEVRELIQERLRQFKDSGLGDHDERGVSASLASASSSADFVAALRALHEEAAQLRQTVARVNGA